jgi:hypothetical protein
MGTNSSSRRRTIINGSGALQTQKRQSSSEKRLRDWMSHNRSSLDQLPSVLITMIAEYSCIGAIMIIGGECSGKTFDTIHTLDPFNDRTWQLQPLPLPLPRRAGAVAIMDNHIFVTGGAAANQTSHCRHLTSCEPWHELPEIPFEIGNMDTTSTVGDGQWWHIMSTNQTGKAWHCVWNLREKRWYSCSPLRSRQIVSPSLVAIDDPSLPARYYLLMIGTPFSPRQYVMIFKRTKRNELLYP